MPVRRDAEWVEACALSCPGGTNSVSVGVMRYECSRRKAMRREAPGVRAIRYSRPGRTTLRKLRMAALPVFVLAAQALVACGGGGEPTSESGNMPVEDPSEFYGTLRAVGGEVGAVLSPGAFVMVEEADRAEGRYPEGLLIVNDTGRPLESELTAGQSVTAFGRLEELQPGEAEEETGLVLDDEALARYEGEPWLSASTVDVPEADLQGETTQ